MKINAETLAKKHRDISVAEFFEKNRHLLGFDNKRKALLTTVKEGVDNALDACEEAHILPEISVELIDMGNDRFRIIIEDNGPGIVKEQVPKIFAKLLYGSKFHALKQTRGQQGIGISAAALYGYLTTGRPIRILSKIHPSKPAYYCELQIDTRTNKPVIHKESTKEWKKDHGTRIELDLEGAYIKGNLSVDAYLKQTAIVNPHATIIYTNPKAEQIIFPRAVDELPPDPKEIKPHPYGVELGRLIKMMNHTESRTLQAFFTSEFSRVGTGTVKDICAHAKIPPNFKPNKINRDQAERIHKAIQEVNIIAPPTDCLAPIGAEALEKGLKKEINAEFYCSVSRSPAVYRGNPFIIECAIAYGGDLPVDSTIRIMRFANRVPLQHQQGACAFTKGIQDTKWKSYGLQQNRNSIPVGPAVIVIHMASVWVPFTSEAKEALAHYPEILKEIRLAIQEVGRLLSRYTVKKARYKDELKKRGYIERYIPYVANALKDILGLKDADCQEIKDDLTAILEKKRGELKDITAENLEYDEEFAKIGQEEKVSEPEDDEDFDEPDQKEKKENKKSK